MGRAMVLNGKICTNMDKIGVSKTFGVGGADELSISLTFSPDATGVKVSFWISTDSENWHSIEATKANDGSLYMTSTTEPQLYSLDVSSGTSFRLTLDSILTGSICAYATSFVL